MTTNTYNNSSEYNLQSKILFDSSCKNNAIYYRNIKNKEKIRLICIKWVNKHSDIQEIDGSSWNRIMLISL